MKLFAICSVVTLLVLGMMGLQTGVFRSKRTPGAENESTAQKPAKPVVVRAKFPQDLAPAAQANAVPQAAEFKVGPEPHLLVFLKPSGALHPWQENVREDWIAESVEATELVVVAGTPRKHFVDRFDYPNGAPPITRYLYELEVSVIEAKTGKILANRLFKNTPRSIMKVETWDTTAIGRAVSVQQVFGWVSRMSKHGFPETHNPAPIVTQVD